VVETKSAPRDELPTLPQIHASFASDLGEGEVELPRSLAPLSASSWHEPDQAPEAGSVWSEAWRRRWLLLGAAALAFNAALLLGRMTSSAHSTTVLPQPAASHRESPPAIDAPPAGAEREGPPPAGPSPESAPPPLDARKAAPPVAPAADDATGAAPERSAPVASKPHGRRVPRTVTTAPRTRFMPSKI